MIGGRALISKNKSLGDLDNFPDPDDLVVEIIENLEVGEVEGGG